MKLNEYIEETRRETDASGRINDNNERAARAADCVMGYGVTCEAKEMQPEYIQDLLTDIRHLCDALGYGFAKLHNDAREMYRIEVAEDGGKAQKEWED